MATTIVTFKTAAGTEVSVDVVGKRLKARNRHWTPMEPYGWEPFKSIIGELGLRTVGFENLNGFGDHFWDFTEFVGVRTERTELTLRDLTDSGLTLTLEPRPHDTILEDPGPEPASSYDPNLHDWREEFVPSPEAVAITDTWASDVVGPYVSDMKVREAAEAAEGIFAYRQERSAINDADRIEEVFHHGLGQALLVECDDDFVEPAVGESPDIPELVLAIAGGQARLCFVLATVDFDDFMAEA